MGNPYLNVWRLRRAHRARHNGWLGVVQSVGGPLVAIALVVPLFRQIFLSFLDLPATFWPAGVSGVVLRLGIGVISLLALEVFTAVVRGPDRAVLALLPIDAGAVVRYELVRVAAERWWILPGAAALLGPIAAAGAVALWVWALLAVTGAWAMGLVVSAAVHLLAIEVAESPRWAPLLDLIRGHNPRPQAAFLYAPGAVLLLCGLIIGQGAFGVASIASGQYAALFWLILPFALALGAWTQLDRLAAASWFSGSAVLSEIDARYAALADREEGLRVYLDWAIRFLPAAVGRFALKDLRHGWRARRSLITGAWLIGLGAFAAGWTADAAGFERAAIVAIAGVWLCAAVGVLMEADEPEFLRVWLPPGGPARWGARALVLAAWVQPCIWLAALSVGFRRGPSEGAVVLAIGLACAAAAVPTAMACGRMGSRGVAVYAPLSVVIAASLAAAVGTA